MNGSGYTDHMRFINALRECLGLEPLYRLKATPVEPAMYGVAFSDGNRRTPRMKGSDSVGPDGAGNQSVNFLAIMNGARRPMRGFGR